MTSSIPDTVRALADLQALRPELDGDIDLGVLDGYRRRAPVFPIDLLGQRWASWAVAAAEGSGAPVDYVAGGLLTAAAGAIGNALRVSPWAGWSEPAVLWMCLVGEPSTGKSPALDPLLTAIGRHEEQLFRDFELEHSAWEEEAVVAKAVRTRWDGEVKDAVVENQPPPPMPDGAAPPAEPGRPRLKVSDATPEALAAVLAANSRGVMVVRDELSGWLGGFGRYTGAPATERAMWIEAYGGRPYVIDRAKAASLSIKHLTVSILGTTQPARLHRLLLATDDDGLAARFLWSWPEPKPPIRPSVSADVSTLETAINWMRDLPVQDGQPTVVNLADEAADLFHHWRTEYVHEVRGAAGMLASTFGKAAGLVLRLSLVLEVLDAVSVRKVPDSVSGSSVARAIALWTDYFAPMAMRTLGDAALSEGDRDVVTLARWIASSRPSFINARHLYRHVRLSGLTEAKRANAALEGLVDAGWLVRAPDREGDTSGRKRGDYRVLDGLFVLLDTRTGGP